MSPAKRTPKVPGPKGSVSRWLAYVKNNAGHTRLHISEESALLFAALVALIGPPEDQVARTCFGTLKALFLHRQRLPRFRKALEVIPATKEGVFAVVRAGQAFVNQTGRSLEDGNVKVDQVVSVMMQVTEPEVYVRHLVRKEFTHLGAIFHPNTLAQTKKELRGIFAAPAGEQNYWEQTKDQLNVITE